MAIEKNEHEGIAAERWATGEIYGLNIPADASSLVAAGADFLTRAFHASGSMAADNSVKKIERAEEFFGGGTGHKLLLTVSYASPETNLPEQLFVKFSRHFEDDLRDSASFMMVSESRFAAMSAIPGFPVTVPFCLFADVEPASNTGLIITEKITFGENGIEDLYPKCLDYLVPDPLEHYRAIIKALARLAGTFKRGGLPAEFSEQFAYNPDMAGAMLAVNVPEEKLVQRATRMFEFVNSYPQLFSENILDQAFQQQFFKDIPDVVAAESAIKAAAMANPDQVSLCHWNANIDNCWFWRDADGQLQCGLLDWAMVGQISVVQAVSGAISGAETFIWDQHLTELLQLFVEEYALHGGPQLNAAQMERQLLLMMAVTGLAYFMGAPVAISREMTDLDQLASYKDTRFHAAENARIQLHMMTKMLNVWQTRKLGDLVRQCGSGTSD